MSEKGDDDRKTMLKMTALELEDFIASQFPQRGGVWFKIEEVEENSVLVRMPYREMYLRPGGTISGPSLMSLADTAMYLVILAMIGPVALAVTTNLNINFLRKPRPADVMARATVLKLGARLAVGEVKLFSDGDDEPVAHATITYSIPPSK